MSNIPDAVVGAVSQPEMASLAPGVDGAVATQGQAEVEAAKDPGDLDSLYEANRANNYQLFIMRQKNYHLSANKD